MAEQCPGEFDIVTCLEMLEHVPDPSQAVAACVKLVRPGGHLYFATINRNPKSWLHAIVGAEHILKLLPQGTHDYEPIYPTFRTGVLAARRRRDLLRCRGHGPTNPLTGDYRLTDDPSVNYLIHGVTTGLGPMTAVDAAVLFDLDGTLIDTAPDFCSRPEQNVVRRRFARQLASSAFAPKSPTGPAPWSLWAYGVTESSEEFEPLRQRLLNYYGQEVAKESRPFPRHRRAAAITAGDASGLGHRH